jgi:DNA polymerase
MTDTHDLDTRFELDDRQRAMLAEMGVRVWMPEPSMVQAVATPETVLAASVASMPLNAVPAAVVMVPVQVRPVPVKALPVAAPQPQAHPPLPVALADMDWTGLRAAATDCQACGLCAQRAHSVFGMGAANAHWLVLGDAPGEEESALGQPFAGEAGRLLDNMLKAVGLSRAGEGAAEGVAGAYVMHATQCPTPDARNPSPDELSACVAYVSRKVALVKPRVILVMGRFAMQSLLQTTDPLGKMRGQVHRYQGVPVVVTYPPAYLLRNQADKGKAWEDLCLALKVVQEAT